MILTVYLILLTGTLWLTYEARSSSNELGRAMPTQLAEIGSTVFEWLLFFMLLMLMFLVPAQTAGAIAGERERQTLVPLQLTLLSPRAVLVGKICASMAFLVLLVVAAVPLLSIAYLIGGVTLGEVLGGTGLVLATGVCVGTMCAAISTYARRVQAATVLSYGLTLCLVLGTLLAYGAAAVVDQSRGVDGADPPAAILALNPVAIVGDLVGSGEGERSSPFDLIESLTRPDDDFARFGPPQVVTIDDGATTTVFAPGVPPPVVIGDLEGPVFQDQFVEGSGGGLPYWAGSLLALSGLAALALAMAARRLQTPAERER